MLKEILGIIIREWNVTVKSPRMILQAFLQPLIYYLLFVPVIAQSIGTIQIHNAIIPYTFYVLPGIISFNAFSAGQYAGISTYMDKLSGEMEVLFGLPIRRSTLLIGKMFSSGIRSITQGVVLIIVAIVLAPSIKIDLGRYFIMLFLGVILSWISVLLFSGFSSLIHSQDAFNIVVNLVVMPITFTSTVFYPLKNFPVYLEWLARINPLTNCSELMRSIIFTGQFDYHYASLLIVYLVVSYLFALKSINGTLQ